MNPLDGPSSTDDDHHTDPDAAGSDGSYSDDYGSESETYDPRRALATTASMQSYVSETAERDSEDDSENSSQPSRVKVRLVSPLASLLLPRSSRVALGAAMTILFLLAAAATAGALAAVDSFYADLEDVANVAPKIVAIERADATIQAAAAVYTLAALSDGDTGLVAHLTALEGNVTEAVTELRVALGNGDHTFSDAAVRHGVWWAKARSHSPSPAPKTSADLSECARVALERSQAAFVAGGSNAVVAQFGSDAVSWRAPAVDALVTAMSAAAELHSVTPTVTDADLALASANAGNVGIATRAEIDAASDAANAAIALSAGALFGFRGAERSPAASLALVYDVVPDTLAATVAAKNGLTTPLVDLRVAMAIATWATRAHANVSALVYRMRPIASNPSTAANVRALATALVGAVDSLSAVVSAVAPHGDPVRFRVPPSTALLAWCTAAAARHGVTYPFNTTAIAGLAEQGLANVAALPLPWLAAEHQRSPATVRDWLRRQRAVQNSAFAGTQRTACSGSLSDVAAESSRAREFLVAAATRYAEARLGEAEDAGRDGLAQPHRDGMIAAVICITAAVVLVAVYGHWGVATRLSASTLPFSSFMQGWWFATLLVIGVVAWATGHALAEFDDATTQDMPRNVGLGSGKFARFSDLERSQALVASAVANVLEPSTSGALQNVSSGTPAGVRDSLITPLHTAVQSSPRTVEDELAGSAILRYTLGKSDTLWAAPSSLPSGGAATSRRAQAACAVSFGSYAAIAGVRMSMASEAAAVAASATSGGIVATSVTSDGAARAAALDPPIQLLQRLALNSGGPLRAECSSTSENAAAFAALIEWASEPVERAINAIRALATAHLQRDASGALSAGSPALQGLLPTQAALSSGSGALERLLAERRANAEAERLWARGMEQDLAARRRPLRRMIVWGSIAGCVVAQGVLALLWRMLFGPNWTPF